MMAPMSAALQMHRQHTGRRREQRKPIAQANAREDGREEMAAAPPEAQTERRGEDLQHARKNKVARAEPHRVRCS